MEDVDVLESIKKVINKVNDEYNFGIEEVTPDLKLKDYFDSLDICEVVIELEKEFAVPIPDEEIFDWKTPADIYVSVLRALNKK